MSQGVAGKYVSEDGETKRFHLRDDYIKRSVNALLVWKSNSTHSTDAMEVESECSTCFSVSGIRPLSLNNFEIFEEWSTSVPVHVQLFLETFINKDTIRRSDNHSAYIEEKLRILYGLYDSLLHLHSKNFVGVYQERNTEELIMNYKSLDTVFKITSYCGATVSLRLADQLIKKKATSDLCYYNTYIKKHSIDYESNVGNKTSDLNLRECILTLMLDNLVKLRFHADPTPEECRSQQLCTLPITVKGIPPDCSIIDEWHDPELCDGGPRCQCKRNCPLTKENYENCITELCMDEEEMLDQFTRLYTWGYCSLWKYVTTSEYLKQRSFIYICLCFFNKYKNAASFG